MVNGDKVIFRVANYKWVCVCWDFALCEVFKVRRRIKKIKVLAEKITSSLKINKSDDSAATLKSGKVDDVIVRRDVSRVDKFKT